MMKESFLKNDKEKQLFKNWTFLKKISFYSFFYFTVNNYYLHDSNSIISFLIKILLHFNYIPK